MAEMTQSARGEATTAADLSALLHARSIALVGISTPGKFGGYLHANLRQLGFEGAIYGVNPRYSALYDQPVYPSLRDLPQAPDCAVLAISNQALLPTLEEAAEIGVGAAVMFGSAFSAPEDGKPSLQMQLAGIAREAGMALCGPNGMGYVSPVHKVGAIGEPMPDLLPGNVTFISHSGSVYDALLQNTRGVRFNYAVSSGNEIVNTMADYMLFALEQPTTRAIAIFLETVRDPENFRRALEQAAERDIPVVALKIGRSERGARLAQAHSGAIAGQDAAYDALFRRYGVCRVQTLDEMVDTLELFQMGVRTRTDTIASIHDSGGERGLLVDLADQIGVKFAPINAETTEKLAGILEPGLEPVNPLDAWGTFNEYKRVYRDSLLALDSDPSTGITLFACDLWPVADLTGAYVDITLSIKDQLKNPIAFLVNLAAATSDEETARARAAGVPILMGTESGLRAVRHLIDYCVFQRAKGTEHASPPSPVDGAQLAAFRAQIGGASGPLDEQASREIASAYGIGAPASEMVGTADEAAKVAEKIGYPVALKTAAEGVTHKTDAGGVLLNLGDERAVREGFERLAKTFGPRVLVQEMIQDGVELILGIVNDAQFGPMLLVGMGGIFVEVLRDHRLIMLPATAEELEEAIRSLRGATLLDGVRGWPAADLGAVVDAAIGLAAMAADLGDLIAEVDINPLIALAERAVAVDALIVPKSST